MSEAKSYTVSVEQDTPVRVVDTPFTAVVSESMSKSRAPVSGVKVLLVHDTLGRVEIGWRFNRGKVEDEEEIPLQGRRHALMVY